MNSACAVRRAGLAAGAFLLLVVGMGSPAVQARTSGEDTGDGTVAAALAAAPVPGGFATWGDLMSMQNTLNAAAEKIQKAAAATRGSGYASVVAAPENRELLVYWQGRVPASVQRVIDEQNRSVPVRVLPARYNQEQLLAQVQRLGANGAIGEAAPRADGSGIDARWAKGRSQAQSLDAQSLLTTASVDVRVDTAAGEVEMTPFAGHCADGASWCREDDTAPYYAGARTGNCTVGWPMHVQGTTSLLSAAHCAGLGETVFDGGGDPMGLVVNDNQRADTLIINARGAGRMWDGGWQNSSYTKPIAGASFSNVGNWLCTSGASSGVLCNIQVKANNLSVGSAYPLVKAEQVDHTSAAGHGDSGGPVFELTSANAKVLAKGTITAGDVNTKVACTGEMWTGRECAWRIYYADTSQALARYSAIIVVDGPQQGLTADAKK